MKPEEAPSCREQKTPGTGTGSVPPLCAGCGSGIWDRFLLRVNERPWHERCLRCCECSRPLRGRCFCRQHRLYCRPDYDNLSCCECSQPLRGSCFCHPDYNKLFPARCSSCQAPVGRREPVLRLLGRIFHPRCLRCGRCSRRLHRGDTFVLREGKILCSRHWQSELGPSDKEETARSEDEEENSQSNSQNSRNSQGKDPKRPKRPRTILSSQQRRAFRASFEVSPKPCRKVRETLAAETGLTVRVVQVWFQNQRAKMKKLARRQQQQQENSRGGISGSGRSRRGGNEDGEDSEGIFQEPPGAVLGSLGEENSQQLLLERLGSPRIPGIPELGNPIDHLYSMQSSYFTS